jgi:hypothetical protein
MLQFLSDIIPSLVRLNERLDNTTILKSKDWIQVIEDPENLGFLNTSMKISYNFKVNPNILRITQNGITRRSSWEYLGENKIELEIEGTYYKFIHKFHDTQKLALMLEGSDKFIFLISEDEYDKLFTNQQKIKHYIEGTLTYYQTESSKPPSISIKENESFDITSFPSLVDEINILKASLVQFPLNNFKEIISSYAKNHSLMASWIKENPRLCKALTDGKLKIKIIEQLFSVSKDNSTFQSQLLAFLNDNLD